MENTQKCETCRCNKICDHNKYGFENCGNYISADVVPKSEEGAECPTCHGTGRIGTTNWLTQNVTKKQIAEEKAKAIAEHEQHIKAEAAREIFEKIEKITYRYLNDADYSGGDMIYDIAELKKKYIDK